MQTTKPIYELIHGTIFDKSNYKYVLLLLTIVTIQFSTYQEEKPLR